MKTLSLIILLISAFGIRWLRWLGLAQQKEYRLDRLKLFFQSPEGRTELKRLLPKRSDFTRTGLKRPKWTHRVILIAGLSLGLIVSFYLILSPILVLNWFAPDSFQSLLLKVIGWLVIIYLSLPIFILLAILPTSLVNWLATQSYLRQAKKIFDIHQPLVIGITGSFGKTSTKKLLTHLLGVSTQVYATPDSYNAKLSVARSICKDYRGQKIAIIEYGAYAKNEISELASWIKPDQAIITGIAPQHLGLFGSLENLIKAKAELVKALPDDGLVFYNSDQPEVKELVDSGLANRSLKQVAFSKKGSDLVKISSAGITEQGLLECLVDGEIIKTKLVGEHYLLGLVGAVTVALEHGIRPEKAWLRVMSFQPDSHFIQIKFLTDGNLLIDDGGTSNPAGFKSAIQLAEGMPALKKILLTPGIIDLGHQTSQIHSQLAEQAKTVFDQVMYLDTTGLAEFKTQFQQKLISQPQQIIKQLGELEAGTIILIEGRIPAWLRPKIDKLTRYLA